MKQSMIRAAVAAMLMSGVVPVLQAQPAAKGDNPPPAAWPGRAYGHGMMWGYGGGDYSAGGYGRGAWGMGAMAGMMGMPGHGMMGWGPYDALDLNESQRSKIAQIQDEVRKKNWEVMGKLLDEQARLRDLYAADKRDPAAIGKQTMKMAELRRQLVESSVDAHNRIDALLSKEQKANLRSFGPGWMMGPD
jgi:Spy/CpxP family protein refolding chaperone